MTAVLHGKASRTNIPAATLTIVIEPVEIVVGGS